MPPPRKEIKKLFYSLEDMANRYNSNKSSIYFYKEKFELNIKQRETIDKKAGKIIEGSDKKNKELLFTESDINDFDLIFQLIEEEQYTLEGAKIQFKKRKNTITQKQSLIKSLENVKKFLTEVMEDKDEL